MIGAMRKKVYCISSWYATSMYFLYCIHGKSLSWGSSNYSWSVFVILSFFSTDPTFIHTHLIPDSAEKNDDKLYFFFREKASEMGQSPMTQSRIGRICLVSYHSSQQNLCWSAQLKGLFFSGVVGYSLLPTSVSWRPIKKVPHEQQ